MRLGITNHWKDRKSAIYWNKDGILRMLAVLRDRDGWETKYFKKHDRIFTWQHDYVELDFSPNPTERLLEWKPDAVLVHADFSSDSLRELEGKGIPIALCYSGGLFTDYERVPQIIFVENKSYVDWMKSRGLNVVQAFGTNTDIFKPHKQPKFFDAFFPATMAEWKRHKLFAEAMGQKGLVCGWWQENEPQVIEDLFSYGVGVLHHQLPESIVHLYNMSHTCLITSDNSGGSQRAVLEAMACGIPPIVMADSDKTTEYVRESGFGAIVEPEVGAIREAVESLKKNPPDPQKGIDYIQSKYTQYHYANAVKSGIESIC